jgi:hypothetical protein
MQERYIWLITKVAEDTGGAVTEQSLGYYPLPIRSKEMLIDTMLNTKVVRKN